MNTAPALPVTVASFAKNRRERVIVRLNTYNGVPFVDIRLFSDDAGEVAPTKKGLAIRPALIVDLIAALQSAEAKAQELGMLDGAAR